MKVEHKVIVLLAVFGLLTWIVDAIVDYLFFYEGSFVGLLITNVPPHEVYVRSVGIVTFIIFGIVISRLLSERRYMREVLRVQSPFYLLLVLTISIFVAEFFVMFLLSLIPRQSLLIEALIDGLILSLMIFPVLFVFVFRPVTLYILERKKAEEELRKRSHDLSERVKELNGLYGTSQLMVDPNNTLDEVFQGVVDLIPPAWHYPEITCARITFKGEEFKTANWKESKWMQSADIITIKEVVGVVEVGYLEQKPDIDEGPFLKEERNLIDGLTRILGDFIERKKAEEEIQKAHYELESQVEERTAELTSVNEQLRQEIAEHKQAEEELIRTQKLAVVGTLAAGLAHEINNPLGNILIYVGMLLSEAKGKDKEKLLVIKRQAKIAAKCLTDLLEFSHPSNIEFASVNLNEVLLKTIEPLKPLIKRAKIQLIQNTHDGIMVVGDPIQLQQAFSNILLNTTETMDGGGNLEIGLKNNGKTIEVEISDNGPGISAEQLDKIFDPFYTTKKGGTGLGLFITHMIISRHNGRIEVESEVGKGSTFTVSLPVGDDFGN